MISENELTHGLSFLKVLAWILDNAIDIVCNVMLEMGIFLDLHLFKDLFLSS